MNIVGYARVSTREQAMKGFSVDEQERRIREYVELYYGDKENVNFRMLREEGASARSMNRPLISEIINQLHKQEINVLIVHKLDRLTRQVKDLHNFLDLIADSKAELVSLKENIDTTTPQGKFFVSVIVLIAQWEEDMIGDRTVRGLLESANQGNYSKGKIPKGYYRDPETHRKLLVDPETSKQVVEIFEKIADGSETAFSLARKLREQQILDKKWTDTAVVQLIQNKVYYGSFQSRKGELTDHSPVIVTKELWDRANEKIGNKGYCQHQYLFKDKMRCASCNCKAAQTVTTKPNGTVYLYYVCPKCRRSISEKEILRLVGDELTPIYIEETIGKELRSLNYRLQSNKNEKELLLIELMYQRLNYDYVQEKVRLLEERIKDDRYKIEQLEDSVKMISFYSLDPEQKKNLVSKYISEIVIDYPTKEIDIKYSGCFARVM